MPLTNNDIDLIERALDDKLSEAEKESFEEKLTSSNEFEQEYNNQSHLLGHLVVNRKLEIKNELKDLYADFKNDQVVEKSSSKQIPFIKYGIAASIVILISILFWVVNRETNNTLELYNQYYEPFYGGPVLRGKEKDSMQIGLSAYYQGDYERALSIFNDQQNREKTLLVGNCYLNLERYQDAEKAFKAALSQGVYQDEARWYLALSYLKQNKETEAKKLLKEIRGDDYHDKALKILEEL